LHVADAEIFEELSSDETSRKYVNTPSDWIGSVASGAFDTIKIGDDEDQGSAA
jgi:hypothetical protein